MAQVRIGISGWLYAGWRGLFYPKGLRQKDELAFAGSRFPTVEINGTHYSLQRPTSFERWYDVTPDGFVFAVKGSRFITHMKRLRDLETALPNFFAQGLFALREKLGPMLWQLPPRFAYDEALLDAFLASLPRDTGAALEIAKRHDSRVEGRALLEIDAVRPLRHAIEVRHPSFMGEPFVALCRRHDVALVVADGPGFPYGEDVTSDFVYVRLHGSTEKYTSQYTDEEIERWADRVVAWHAGGEPGDAVRWGEKKARRKARDVYVYFDNDVKARAPEDALRLIAAVERRTREAGRASPIERRV